MTPLQIGGGTPFHCLAVGAHSDDVEIGAGGLILRLVAERPGLHLRVVVMTALPDRAQEAESAAAAFATPADVTAEVHSLPDGHLPARWEDVKTILEGVAAEFQPDLVIGPGVADAHQDHRTVASILPTVFRDHLLLQYEIPKWDGDLGAGRPTHYLPLTAAEIDRKCDLLEHHFPTQAGRDWFSRDTFTSLARLRGLECRSPFAEAFTVTKAVLCLGSN